MALTTTAAVIQWLASGADEKAKAASKELKEPNAVARALATGGLNLAGAGPVEQAQVAQWGAWVATQTEGFGAEAAELNQVLSTRSFLAGQRLSLADVQVYWAIAHGVQQTVPGPLSGLPHLLRWFNHVQHALRSGAFAAHDAALLPKLLPIQAIYKPIAMPVFAKEGAGAGAGAGGARAKQAPAQQQQQQQQDKGKEKENKPQSQPQQQQKQQPQPPKEGGKGDGKKAGKGEGGKKGGAAAKPAEEEPDPGNPNCLNIVVGQIVKAWPHPESEKLWCEEIDVGEEAPRQIASGLRQFYANASDLTGRKVLVLANLKPRKLAGFASAGMVLCASNADHTEVKFVEVPASAQVGDRVVFEGEGVGPVCPPLEPNKLAKKKCFETVAPDLVTDAKGVCRFKGAQGGAPFAVQGSGEVCTAPLPNAHVS